MTCNARNSSLLFAGLLCPLLWSAALHAVPTSGVAGTVTLSPACPGPERPGRACTSPYADAGVQLLAREGAIVASATTGPNGAFRIALQPGRYELRVDVSGLYPRCEPAPVTVRKGKFSRAVIRCDSGMR